MFTVYEYECLQYMIMNVYSIWIIKACTKESAVNINLGQ